MSGPDIAEADHEITLHEEVAVVEKRTVPKERMRLDKDVVTNDQAASDKLRNERIEAEGDIRS
jgi:stress response protein YsnF